MWAAPTLNGKTFHLEYAPFFFCNRQKYNQNVKKAIESPADGQRNTKKIPPGCNRVKASEILSEIASSGISPK